MQVKISELKLETFVAEHDLFYKVVQHLHHFIKSVCVDSDVAVGFKASRTKTTKIVDGKKGPYVTKKF